MKQRRQIIICFLTVVILSSIFLLTLPHPALAQTIYPGCKIEESKDSKALPIIINFSLPGITTEVKDEDTGKTEYQVKNLPCFIIGLYTYFAGVAGILATVMVMYGGIKYVVSFGSPQKISDAKDTIFAALSGLVLMLGAYVLLNFINPNLTDLKMPDVTGIKKVPDYICGKDAACSDSKYTDSTSCEKAGETWSYEVTPVIAGRTSCGDKGILNDVECFYDDCEPGLGGVPRVCARGRPKDPDKDIDKWFCMTAEERCERISDANEGVGPGTHEELCSPLTIANLGRCKWWDESAAEIFKNDQCYWSPALYCPPSGNLAGRIDCSECVNRGVECKNYTTKGGKYFGWLIGGVDKEVVCLADQSTRVYKGWGSEIQGKYQGICCKNKDNSLQCWNGIELSDPKFP